MPIKTLFSIISTVVLVLNLNWIELKDLLANSHDLILAKTSFSDTDRALELELETFYSKYKEAIEQARVNNEWCVTIANPSSLEISPMVKYTRPNGFYGPSLLEQFTECYKNYAKQTLSFICEKERELKEALLSFEEKKDEKKTEDLELKKNQLDFIVSERLHLEKPGSLITVKAVKNNSLARAVLGSDEFAIVQKKITDLSFGLNSCDKILEEGE